MRELKKGTRVLVNEAYVIVGDLGFDTAGPVTRVIEVLGGDRLRVAASTECNRPFCFAPRS